MRREALAPVAVVAGLALAGLSAATWHDGSDDTAAPRAAAPATTYDGPNVSERVALPSFLKPRASPGVSKGRRATTRLVTAAPRRLELPSIGVSADVFPIGNAGSQVLVPPSDYTTVGWWSPGAEPGAGGGTTIIAGHTVHTGGGALDHLGDVRVGDQVTVERGRQDLRYDVTSVRTFHKGTLAAQSATVFRQDGPERLAIVTCGDWNGEIYLSNVVVIATNPRPVTAG